jgi:hypothetical protein
MSEKRHFVSLTINNLDYTVMLKCNHGYPPTMEDPGEQSEIELEKLFDSNGNDISKNVLEKDWEQLYEWFNNPPSAPEISFNTKKIEIW